MKVELIRVTKNTVSYFKPLILEEEIAEKTDFLIGAVTEENICCGILAYEFSGNAYEITYLAVADAYRHQRVGTQLIHGFCRRIADSGELYQISCFVEEERIDICEFFRSQGNFELDPMEQAFHIPVEYIRNSEILKNSIPGTHKCEEYFSLPEYVRNSFETGLLHKNIFYLEDMKSERENYIDFLCLCTLTRGEIGAAVFFLMEEGRFILNFAYSNHNNARDLILLFQEAFRRVNQTKFPMEELEIAAMNGVSEKLIRFILPGTYRIDTIYRAMWDMTVNKTEEEE